MKPGNTTSSGVEIRLLGGFSVLCDGQALDDRAWRGRKAQSLVKLLAVEPSHRLHREQIADRLWPDLDTEAADRQLHKAIHAARRALEPALESGVESRYVTTRDRMVALEPASGVQIDADEFEVAAEAALAADDVAAAEAAVARYAGDLLPEDLYDDGAEARRSRLRTLFLRVAGRLAERYAAAARYDEAIETAARLLVVEPANEGAHRCLMSVYARVGERHRALQQYRDCVRVLGDELDAEPSPETVALHAALLDAPPAVAGRPEPVALPVAPAAPPTVAAAPRSWWPAAVAGAVVALAVLAYPLSQAAEVRDLAGAISRSVDRALAPDAGLVALAGRVDTMGVRVEALDSASGWAGLSDGDGRFVVPDVAWRPGGAYRLLVTVDMGPAAVFTVQAPEERPESGVVEVGSLAPLDATLVDPARVGGANASSRIAFDSENDAWYAAVFWTVTMAQPTHIEKLAALNAFVAARYDAPTGSIFPRAPRETLERGSRYSGPLVLAMATLARAGGYDVRIVEMMSGGGEGVVHSVVEVFYEGKWHAYDPAFGLSATNEAGRIASHVELNLNAELVSRMGYDRAQRPGWRNDAIPELYRSGAHHFRVFDE